MRWPVLLSVFGMLLLSDSARAAAEGQAVHPRQGEAFTFSLRILGLFDAGRARLAITPPVHSGPNWQVNVVGEAEATGLARALTGMHDDYRLILDGGTLLPRKMMITESGFRTRTVVMQLDGKKIDILARKPGTERHIVGELPSEPLEPVAVLLLLRGVRLEQGDLLDMIIMDGTNFYQGSIEVQKREEITTVLGTQRAIRVLCRGERITENGRKMGRPPREATMWLTDNPLRLPLRIEAQTDFGTGEFELTSYEPARRPIALPHHLLGITEHR